MVMKVFKPFVKFANFVQSQTAKPAPSTQWRNAILSAPKGKVIYVSKKETPIIRDAHAKPPKTRNQYQTADRFFWARAQHMIYNNPPGSLAHRKGLQMQEMIVRTTHEALRSGSSEPEYRPVDADLRHVAEHMF